MWWIVWNMYLHELLDCYTICTVQNRALPIILYLIVCLSKNIDLIANKIGYFILFKNRKFNPLNLIFRLSKNINWLGNKIGCLEISIVGSQRCSPFDKMELFLISQWRSPSCSIRRWSFKWIVSFPAWRSPFSKLELILVSHWGSSLGKVASFPVSQWRSPSCSIRRWFFK